MKKCPKRLLSLIIAAMIAASAVFSANASVVSDEYPDFEFEPDLSETFSVSAYKGTDGEVIIPEYVFERYVQRVDENAFDNNEVVTSVYLHDGMTAVKDRGFYGCENLKNVYFSKDMVTLWKYSFAYCPKISSALLRNTKIGTIYAGCFYDDNSLKYVALPDTIRELGPIAFANTAVESVFIPEGCETIGKRCFAFDESLKYVYVPASVTTLEDEIFKGSDNVTVYTVEGSEMQTYCEDNGVDCEIIEKMPATELGDVNNDGLFDIRDATEIQRELVGSAEGLHIRNADINKDCVLDIRDVTKIQRILAHSDIE